MLDNQEEFVVRCSDETKREELEVIVSEFIKAGAKILYCSKFFAEFGCTGISMEAAKTLVNEPILSRFSAQVLKDIQYQPMEK